MIHKTRKNIKGRPKINWDSPSYADTNLKNLDRVKSKQVDIIKSLNEKIFKIDKLIERNQKLISKQCLSKKPILDQLYIHNDELNSIIRAMEQKSKIYSKNNQCITLIRGKNCIRGKISYFGRILWCHIGSNHKFGLIHKGKKIRNMSKSDLCDEFRNKIKIQIKSSWIINDNV